MRNSSWAKAVFFGVLLSTSVMFAYAGESVSINPYPFQGDAAKQEETDQVPVETLQAVGAIRARMNRAVPQEVQAEPPSAAVLEKAPPPPVMAYTPEEPELEPEPVVDEPEITYTYEEPELEPELDLAPVMDEPEIQEPEMAYTPPSPPPPAAPAVIVESGTGAAEQGIEISTFEELPRKPKSAPAAVSAAAPPMEEQLLSMQPAETAESPPMMPAREVDKPLAIYTPPQNPAERWQVAQGADIRETLASWSREAGVNFIWVPDDRFQVLQSFTLQGAYEDAVQTLLDQYMRNDERPIGSLHIDPDTGERVLVIESYSQS